MKLKKSKIDIEKKKKTKEKKVKNKTKYYQSKQYFVNVTIIIQPCFLVF